MTKTNNALADEIERGVDPNGSGDHALIVDDEQLRIILAALRTPPAAPKAVSVEAVAALLPLADCNALKGPEGIGLSDWLYAVTTARHLRRSPTRTEPSQQVQDAEARGFAAGIEAAAKVCEDSGPATQDMSSTDICEALDRAAGKIRALSSQEAQDGG